MNLNKFINEKTIDKKNLLFFALICRKRTKTVVSERTLKQF